MPDMWRFVFQCSSAPDRIEELKERAASPQPSCREMPDVVGFSPATQVGLPSHTVSRCVTLLAFLLLMTTPAGPGWVQPTPRPRPKCCSGRGAAKSHARRMRRNQHPPGGPPNSGRRCRSLPCTDMACFTSVSIAALPDAPSTTDRMVPRRYVHHTFRPAGTLTSTRVALNPPRRGADVSTSSRTTASALLRSSA